MESKSELEVPCRADLTGHQWRMIRLEAGAVSKLQSPDLKAQRSSQSTDSVFLWLVPALSATVLMCVNTLSAQWWSSYCGSSSPPEGFESPEPPYKMPSCANILMLFPTTSSDRHSAGQVQSVHYLYLSSPPRQKARTQQLSAFLCRNCKLKISGKCEELKFSQLQYGIISFITYNYWINIK